MAQIGEVRHFSRTTQEADEKFWAACRHAGVEPVLFRHPRQGPGGESLHLSVVQLGPTDAPKHLVIVSGTHGVEGFAGSAIQCRALSDPGFCRLPPDIAITFVHLINPYGCAWDRKETENNVDLHRNFIYTAPPYPTNDEFDRIADFLHIDEWSGPSRDAADARLKAYIDTHGMFETRAVIAQGQHRHPLGIRFNGTEPTWSKRTMDRIVAGWLRHAKQVAVLDVHTGYGKAGASEVFTYSSTGSGEYERLAAWLGGVTTLQKGKVRLAVHPRMPYNYIADLVPGAEVTVAALEFGTDEGPRDELTLIREDNFIHLRGDPFSPEGRVTRARMRAVFYLERESWKEYVLKRGDEVLAHMKLGLQAWRA